MDKYNNFMNKYEFQMQNLRWIDLVEPKKADLNQLSQELSIPNRILINALDPEHLPKYELIDSSAVIYLRIIDNKESKKKSKATNIQDLTTKITLIIKGDLLISIHRLDNIFMSELRKECQENNTLSLKEIIKKIITSSMMTFDEPITNLENRVEAFEENIFNGIKTQDIIKEGYFLKRKASAIRKVLKFSLDILVSLEHRPDFIWRDFQGLRESIERNLFYAEDTLENVTGLLNLYISLASQKTNEVMRVLTVFSIFFLPLNFLTGVYGMNFDHMPELKTEYGYFFVLGFMVLISTSIFFWFYKKGWLKNEDAQNEIN